MQFVIGVVYCRILTEFVGVAEFFSSSVQKIPPKNCEMYTKCTIGVLIIAFAIKSVRLDDMTALQNEIMDSSYNGAVGGGGGVDQMNYGGNHLDINNKNQNIENLAEPPRRTWFDSIRKALGGHAGLEIAIHMAKEMIARSTGNSQVRMHC